MRVNSPVLFSPLLLATDGSASAYLAQIWMALIAPAVTSESAEHLPIVRAVTVQPRHSSRSNRLLKKRQREPIATLEASSIPPEPQPPEPGEERAPEVPPVAAPDHIESQLQVGLASLVSVELEVRQGRPATEILNYARSIQAGLIAVGSRGTGGVRELLLGGVSAVIARYAPCSVLIARRGAIAPAEKPHLEHVLLVVSAAPGSWGAIAAVRQLVPAGVRRVTILYAQSPLNADYLFGPFVAPNPSWQLNQSLQQAHREQGEQVLQQATAALSHLQLEVHSCLQMGEAGHLICQIAQQQQVDLIVMGSNTGRRREPIAATEGATAAKQSRLPRNPLRKWQPGDRRNPRPALWNSRLSPTEDYTIHHAPCPVLLCRQGMAGQTRTE